MSKLHALVYFWHKGNWRGITTLTDCGQMTKQWTTSGDHLLTFSGLNIAASSKQFADAYYQKNLMLLSKSNPRCGAAARKDYSPIRKKNQMKIWTSLEFSQEVLNFAQITVVSLVTR